MIAGGNCRFYTQSEHEFIGRIQAVRLVALSIRAVEAAELNLLACISWMPLIRIVVMLATINGQESCTSLSSRARVRNFTHKILKIAVKSSR